MSKYKDEVVALHKRILQTNDLGTKRVLNQKLDALRALHICLYRTRQIGGSLVCDECGATT